MNTFKINVLQEEGVKEHFVKTDADKLVVQRAIDFVANGSDKSVTNLLTAIRMLGHKAVEVKVEALEEFDM